MRGGNNMGFNQKPAGKKIPNGVYGCFAGYMNVEVHTYSISRTEISKYYKKGGFGSVVCRLTVSKLVWDEGQTVSDFRSTMMFIPTIVYLP